MEFDDFIWFPSYKLYKPAFIEMFPYFLKLQNLQGSLGISNFQPFLLTLYSNENIPYISNPTSLMSLWILIPSTYKIGKRLQTY